MSLIEVLVAVAILATAAGVSAPAARRFVEQADAHAVFLDFRRQVMVLRRDAYLERREIALDPARRASLVIASPWTYRLSAPLRIGSDGRCSSVSAVLVRDGRSRMFLRSGTGDCRFIQVLPTAGDAE